MGILCTFIGILFLANPCFRLIDFFPDFIGCILIIAGTSKAALFDYRIEQAKKYATYLAFVSFGKLFTAFYIFTKAKDYLLPASFGFAVLEGMLMVGMFVSLIGGYQYLLSRENCEDIHLKNSESASVVCFVFSIARAVIGFAPEILSLGSQKNNFDYTFTPTAEQNAALLKPYAEILAFALILVFGIYFAIICGKFLIGIYGDKKFISGLSERYEKYICNNIEKVNVKRVKFTLLLFFGFLLLLFNQILDFVNVIPNTLAYIFLIAGTVYMIKALGCTGLKSSLPVYIPLIALSVYNNIVQTRLLSGTDIDFIYENMFIKKVPEVLQNTANLPFLTVPIIAEYVILALLVIKLCRTLDNLEFLRDKDTISIFEILFTASTAVYFISCCYTYFGQFIRTANTFVTQKLEVYVKYDSILVIFEWMCLIFFVLMLYSGYRYGADVLARVKPKEDSEY